MPRLRLLALLRAAGTYHSMLTSSKMASCALAVASGHHHHSWCLYDIPVLETNVQNVERIMHSFLAVAPYRAPGQEFTHCYLLVNFRTRRSRCLQKLFATHRALRDICVKMITLPPWSVNPVPVNQMGKTYASYQSLQTMPACKAHRVR